MISIVLLSQNISYKTLCLHCVRARACACSFDTFHYKISTSQVVNFKGRKIKKLEKNKNAQSFGATAALRRLPPPQRCVL